MLTLGEREPGDALLGQKLGEEAKAAMLGMITRDRIQFQEFWWPDISERRVDQQVVRDYRYDPQNHVRIVWSQYPLLLDPVGSMSCGRGVMKTIGAVQRRAIQDAIVYTMVKPCIFMMLGHSVDRLQWGPLTQQIGPTDGHPVFRALVSRIDAADRQIWFKNGSVLTCVSQGKELGGESPTGVQGARSSSMYLDESQQSSRRFMSESAQTQAGLDPFDPEDQRNRGAALRYTGVLDNNIDSAFSMNERDPNSLFRCAAMGPNGREFFRNWIWKMPSVAGPWTTSAKHEQSLVSYHCDADNGTFTTEYYRNVWGMVPYGQNRLFPDELRLPCSVMNPSWRHVKLRYQDWERHSRFSSTTKGAATWVESSWDYLANALPPRRPGWVYGMGCDPGEDVTSICLWCQNPDTKVWQWEANVTLMGWGGKSDFAQCTVLWWLAGNYDVVFMGQDATGWGHNFCGPLRDDARLTGRCEPLLREYKMNGTIIERYEVSRERVAAATTERYFKRIQEEEQPVYVQANQFSMGNLGRMLQMRQYMLPSVQQAEEIHRELGSIQQQISETASGAKSIKYLPKHPHFVSSAQVFTMARHEQDLLATHNPIKEAVSIGNASKWGGALLLESDW